MAWSGWAPGAGGARGEYAYGEGEEGVLGDAVADGFAAACMSRSSK